MTKTAVGFDTVLMVLGATERVNTRSAKAPGRLARTWKSKNTRIFCRSQSATSTSGPIFILKKTPRVKTGQVIIFDLWGRTAWGYYLKEWPRFFRFCSWSLLSFATPWPSKLVCNKVKNILDSALNFPLWHLANVSLLQHISHWCLNVCKTYIFIVLQRKKIAS